jgi:hypothetical protein
VSCWGRQMAATACASLISSVMVLLLSKSHVALGLSEGSATFPWDSAVKQRTEMLCDNVKANRWHLDQFGGTHRFCGNFQCHLLSWVAGHLGAMSVTGTVVFPMGGCLQVAWPPWGWHPQKSGRDLSPGRLQWDMIESWRVRSHPMSGEHAQESVHLDARYV